MKQVLQTERKLPELLTVEFGDFISSLEVQKITKSSRTSKKTKKKRPKYLNAFFAFDIETSKLVGTKDSFMYCWQFAFSVNPKEDSNYIVGRSWSQFIELIDIIEKVLNDPDKKIVCYVHNLSFEFMFLSGVLHFETENVFNTDKRQVLYCSYKNIEFRCSQMLTNMGLGAFTSQMKVKHKKLSGAKFNYDKIRYPWSKLKKNELNYCINDVVGLIESLQVFFEEDNYYTIPLTSTGFIRRDMKKAIQDGCSHKYMVSIQPSYDLFTMLKSAFRGGNTHANRWFVDSILENVKSADRSSSYPDVMCNRQVPKTPFKHLGALKAPGVVKLIKDKKALLMLVNIKGCKLKKDSWSIPYIPINKCTGIKPKDCIMDNGRVLYTKSDFTMVLTDIDLQIILNEYNLGGLIFLDVWASNYGYLPDPIINTIIKYYKLKTELKNVEGQELYYNKSKNKLNAGYGMSVTSPCQMLMLYDDGHLDNDGNLNEWYYDNSKTPEQILEQHNNQGFMPFQWGVWITSWARYELELGLNLASDPFNIIYCDTDSIKYIGDIDFSDYNNRCIENSTRSGAYANDTKGTTHYMGVFETEDTAELFITQGAKKYCCLYPADSENPEPYLKLTCAGVNKKKGSKELEKAGGITKFKDGFVFIDAGGTNSIYNDRSDYFVNVGKHQLHITKNISIVDDIYTLGKTAEFETLVTICKKEIDNVIKGAKLKLSVGKFNRNIINLKRGRKNGNFEKFRKSV